MVKIINKEQIVDESGMEILYKQRIKHQRKKINGHNAEESSYVKLT
jgi:hypothetical protein